MLSNKLVLEQVVKKMKILNKNKTSLILIKISESQNYNKYIDVKNALSYARSDKKKKTRNGINILFVGTY